MISIYRPGTSSLHRLSAGPKILFFAILTLIMGLSLTSLPMLAIALVVVVGLYVLAGFGLTGFARQALALRWVLLAMLIPQLVFLPIETAAINSSRVLLVILACTLLSMTTRVPALLEACERGLTPLWRFGVDPRRIGLVLALTLTTIPTIVRFGMDIRDAQRARGITPWPHTFVVPLLVASLRHADHLAEALVARGAS
ncbi:MAG: cobalt transporter permease [Microbacteriaceae bacterium]|jgi:biotin transport system permease protein|nr:cobalt transporter permease [Microbacteriaceae bacterium]